MAGSQYITVIHGVLLVHMRLLHYHRSHLMSLFWSHVYLLPADMCQTMPCRYHPLPHISSKLRLTLCHSELLQLLLKGAKKKKRHISKRGQRFLSDMTSKKNTGQISRVCGVTPPREERNGTLIIRLEWTQDNGYGERTQFRKQEDGQESQVRHQRLQERETYYQSENCTKADGKYYIQRNNKHLMLPLVQLPEAFIMNHNPGQLPSIQAHQNKNNRDCRLVYFNLMVGEFRQSWHNSQCGSF